MKQKDLLIISILTFTVTVIWIVSTIVHNITTSTISETLGLQIEPIPATFDLQTIQALKERQAVSPLYTFSVIKNNGGNSTEIATEESSLIQRVSPTPVVETSPTVSPVNDDLSLPETIPVEDNTDIIPTE